MSDDAGPSRSGSEPSTQDEERVAEYEARVEERRGRLEARAAKARRESESAYRGAMERLDAIPPGQPILVGHHSERRHRRDLERIDQGIGKSVALDKKADELERRAEGVGSAGISSDDPAAVAKLEAKLRGLLEDQERMKAVNAAHRRFLKDPASLEASDLSEEDKAQVRTYKPGYSWEPHPYPPYCLQNGNKEIQRVRKRIKDLEARAGDETRECIVAGVEVVDNVELNRLQLFFPGKPNDATRKLLKSRGFRWAPSQGAWQRHRSNAATYEAERILRRIQEADA